MQTGLNGIVAPHDIKPRHIKQTGYHDLTEISEPSSPSANVGRIYAKDINSITTLFYQDSTGRERVLNGGTYDVREFGAVGDGTTDDVAAIQAAINAANTAGGGIVYAHPGIYIIGQSGSQISSRDYGLLIKSNVYLVGAGSGITTFQADASTDMDMITSPRTSSASNMGFIGFTMDGNQANQSDGQFNLYLRDVDAVFIDDLKSVDPGNWGFRFQEITNLRAGSIQCDHAADLNADGVHFLDCSDCVIGKVLINTAGDDGLIFDAENDDTHDISIGEVVITCPVTTAAAGRGVLFNLSSVSEALSTQRSLYNISLPNVVTYNCKSAALVFSQAQFRNILVNLVDYGSQNGLNIIVGSSNVTGYLRNSSLSLQSWTPDQTGIQMTIVDGVVENNSLDAKIYDPGDTYNAIVLRGSYWNADISVDYDPNGTKSTPTRAVELYCSDSNIRVSGIDDGTINLSFRGDRNTAYLGALTNASTNSIAFESGADGNLIIGGSYDGSISDSGAGNLVLAAFNGAQRALPGWKVLAASGVAVSHTGDTTETTLATVTVPAGAIGANGMLKVTTIWRSTDGGAPATRQPRIRFSGASGTVYGTATLATGATTTQKDQRVIHNRNSVSSQIGFAGGAGNGGWGNSTAVTTSSVDTSVATTVVLTGQLGNSGDTIILDSYIVEIFYQA